MGRDVGTGPEPSRRGTREAAYVNGCTSSSPVDGPGRLSLTGCRRTGRTRVLTILLALVFVLLETTSAFAVKTEKGGPVVPPLDGYEVTAVHVVGLSIMKPSYFLELLDLPSGSLFTADRLRRGLARVYRKGLFRDLRVEALAVSPVDRRLALRVTVDEEQRFRRVVIRGNDTVLFGRMKKATGLKKGMIFRHDLLEETHERLLRFLSDAGFPDAAVELSARSSPKPGFLDLEISVREGLPNRIRKLTVEGTGDLSYARFVYGLRLGGIADSVPLNSDAERILRRMKKQGYYRAKLPVWSYEDERLRVTIQGGPRYRIRFDGNETFSEGVLLKEYRFEDLEEDFGKEILEDVASRFRLYYRNHGYPFAQVAASYREAEAEGELAFYIFEGDPVRIENLRFEGVSLSKKRVDEILGFLGYRPGKPFSEKNLQAGLDRMLALYHALGYLDAEVLDVRKDFDSVPGGVEIEITVREGPRTRIRELSYSGGDEVVGYAPSRWTGLRPGDYYNDVDVSDARFSILEQLGHLGYRNASVRVDRRFSEDGRFVDLEFQTFSGFQLVFGKTIVAGNVRTRDELIVKELGFREGTPFDYREVLRGKQRLHGMGIFSGISVDVLPGSDPRLVRDVLVRVEEDRFGSVDFGIGYGDLDRTRGFVEISHRNVNGLNRRVSLKGEASSLLRRLSLNYQDPWLLLEYKLPLHATLLGEYQQVINADTRTLRYESNKISLIVGVTRELTDTITAGGEYEYSFIDTFNIQPGQEPSRQDIGVLGLGSLTPTVSRDTRNNPFNPSTGSINALSVRWASALLFSESTFVKPTLQSSWYLPLLKPLILGLSFRGGTAWPIGDTEELPISERFFLGGGNTVRGYVEDGLGPKSVQGDPVGGNAFVLYNMEWRADVWKGIGLVAFIDAGNVWREVADIDPSDVRAAWGGGLRYDTPVGPFRLDYGRKFDPEPGESVSEIHFNLGHAF